jgi:hypothetical protein
MKTFFVDVLMTGSGLRVYSNCFATPGEEPSPTSGSFSFGTLGDRLVFNSLVALFLQLKKSKFRYYAKNITG